MKTTFDIRPDTKAKQCAAMFAALQRGPLSTIAARQDLGISHPAGRVLELRKAGHAINTLSRSIEDDRGRKHRSALYVLDRATP